MKGFLLIAILLGILSLDIQAETMGVVKAGPILDEVSVTGAGSSITPLNTNRTFQASGTSATAGAAVILVEVSNDDTVWTTDATLSLTLGASATADTSTSTAAWKYVRGNVVSISGTNATVSLDMGVQY